MRREHAPPVDVMALKRRHHLDVLAFKRQHVTMSESKSEERDAQRRRQILEAARASFMQLGFAKTSIDDIARRAHISRPLVYRKFKSKEAILAAVFEDLFVGRYERRVCSKPRASARSSFASTTFSTWSRGRSS